MGSTPQEGGRTRDLLLASCRAARRCGEWKTSASLAGWLLEQAGGDATAAMYLDAPVPELQLARAREHLHTVVTEECYRHVRVPSTLPAPPEEQASCVVVGVDLARGDDATAMVIRCSCGRVHTAEAWAALPHVGFMSDGGSGLLELKHCPCGSTRSVAVPPLRERDVDTVLVRALGDELAAAGAS